MLSRTRTLMVLLAGLLIVGAAVIARVVVDSNDAADRTLPTGRRACGSVAADDATGAKFSEWFRWESAATPTAASPIDTLERRRSDLQTRNGPVCWPECAATEPACAFHVLLA